MTSEQYMTIEVHDVSEAFADQIVTIHNELKRINILRPTLLVCPAYSDARGKIWDLRHSQSFSDWLKDLKVQGSEFIQHGLSHRMENRLPPGIHHAFMHYCYARGCEEFAYLNYDQAINRLVLGKRIIEESGLGNCQGFVAPAWQLSDDARTAIFHQGFSFTATFAKLYHNKHGHAEPSPALTYAAGHWSIDRAKRIVMQAKALISSGASLLRVAIHPEDLNHKGLLKHIIGQIQQLRTKRQIIQYCEWLKK